MIKAGSGRGIGWGVVLLIGLLGCGADDEDPALAAGGTGGGQGVGGGSGVGGTGGAGPVTYGDSDCGACVDAQCAAELTACKSEQECATYLGCLLECPTGADGNVDPACEEACPDPTSTAAVTARSQLTVCREVGPGATQCPACGVEQEGPSCSLVTATCPASAETEPCSKCEDESCCETYAAYAANPEAVALKECLVGCLGIEPDCEQTCGAQHPDGIADWAARSVCLFHHCLDECLDVPPEPCEKCLYGDCIDSFCASQSTTEGWLLSACFATCEGDAACEADCVDQYPEAYEGAQEFLACGSVLCGESC
jgi:hypothetical protein